MFNFAVASNRENANKSDKKEKVKLSKIKNKSKLTSESEVHLKQ
jgi:hypothetical protein